MQSAVIIVSTHSRAEAAASTVVFRSALPLFQHTAARRRLLTSLGLFYMIASFNTQPRGGGCIKNIKSTDVYLSFNTQPRGGGCMRQEWPRYPI